MGHLVGIILAGGCGRIVGGGGGERVVGDEGEDGVSLDVEKAATWMTSSIFFFFIFFFVVDALSRGFLVGVGLLICLSSTGGTRVQSSIIVPSSQTMRRITRQSSV